MEDILFELENGEMVAVEGFEDAAAAHGYIEEQTGLRAEFLYWASEEEVEDMGIDTY